MSLEPIATPEPKKTGHRWVDIVVALSALSISVVSIFVAQGTSHRMERLTQANSLPFIQLDTGNANENRERELSFIVSNVGTGPARLHAFHFEVDDQPLSNDGNPLDQLLLACCESELNAAVEAANGDRRTALRDDLSSPVARRFLAVGQDVTALRWRMTPENELVWRALDRARQSGRIRMDVCYCSVFDECWVSRTGEFPPREVNSCEASTEAPTP